MRLWGIIFYCTRRVSRLCAHYLRERRYCVRQYLLQAVVAIHSFLLGYNRAARLGWYFLDATRKLVTHAAAFLIPSRGTVRRSQWYRFINRLIWGTDEAFRKNPRQDMSFRTGTLRDTRSGCPRSLADLWPGHSRDRVRPPRFPVEEARAPSTIGLSHAIIMINYRSVIQTFTPPECTTNPQLLFLAALLFLTLFFAFLCMALFDFIDTNNLRI